MDDHERPLDDAGTPARDDGAVLSSIPGVRLDAGLKVSVETPGRATSSRPRGRKGRPLAVGLAALILLPAAWAGQAGGSDAAEAADGSVTVASSDTATPASPATPVHEVELPRTFARVGGLELLLPDEQVLMVGFHEASMDDALELGPVGDSIANENRTKFTAPPTDADGPAYVVLSSRGRPNPATSAVDLVMEDRTPVLSPVDGEVVAVEPYALYGKYPDTRIEIRPTAAPDHRVVIIHVADVRVRVGDAVEAGRTGIAGGPNRFPFASHIDRYFDQERWPHVHIEVKRVG